MFPIIELPSDESSQLEQLGTKPKSWYRDEAGNMVLFKQGRPGTGENWAEKVCCEICKVLNLPHATYDFARMEDQYGVISPTFVSQGGRLILGNELLAKIHQDYDETRMYQYSQHTIGRVIASLKVLNPGVPLNWEAMEGIETAEDVFTGYLMLDALVGNQDRHHENWGLVRSPKNGVTLAPTYDHASSLGRNELDETRVERLNTRDVGRSMETYCNRAKSALYKSVSDRRPMSTLAAFREAQRQFPNAGQIWANKLGSLEIVDFKDIFDQVPHDLISQPAEEFALKMLEINKNRILSS